MSIADIPSILVRLEALEERVKKLEAKKEKVKG